MSRKLLESIDSCTGCGACLNTCSSGAISLKQNKYGFWKVCIDTQLCSECHICEKTCPHIQPSLLIDNPYTLKRYAFATWAKDETLHKNSNSGGLFSVFATEIIKYGGKVCAAKYDGDFNVYHTIIDNTKDLSALAYSKFSQSYIGTIFKQIKKLLSQNIVILFVGTPCQILGLYSYLNNKPHNLITVQFPCTGIPAPLLFQKYISHQFDDNAKNIKNIYCEVQDKSNINKRFMICTFKNKPPMKSCAEKDPFVRLWNSGYGIEEHCFQCTLNIEPKYVDFIWGNFWQLGELKSFPVKNTKYSNGVSFLIINSTIADNFFNFLKPKLDYYPRELKEIVSGHYCMYSTTQDHILMKKNFLNLKRDDFFNDLSTHNFSYIIDTYIKSPMNSTNRLFKLSRKLSSRHIALIWRILYYLQILKNRKI